MSNRMHINSHIILTMPTLLYASLRNQFYSTMNPASSKMSKKYFENKISQKIVSRMNYVNGNTVVLKCDPSNTLIHDVFDVNINLN